MSRTVKAHIALFVVIGIVLLILNEFITTSAARAVMLIGLIIVNIIFFSFQR